MKNYCRGCAYRKRLIDRGSFKNNNCCEYLYITGQLRKYDDKKCYSYSKTIPDKYLRNFNKPNKEPSGREDFGNLSADIDYDQSFVTEI